jgi:hypothetical protein
MAKSIQEKPIGLMEKTFNEKAHQYEEKHLRKTHHSDGKRF